MPVKELKVLILSFLIVTSFPSLSDGFHPTLNQGGHDTFTTEGANLKKEVHKDDEDGGRGFNEWADQAIEGLRTGAHDEDSTKRLGFYLSDKPIGVNGDGNFFNHFYNPDTGQGLKGNWGDPAPRRAVQYMLEIAREYFCRPSGNNKLTNEDKKKMYDYFGRILHLIQDMGNPSHTKDDLHVFTNTFEDYVRDHWSDIVNSDYFRKAVTPEEYLKGDYGVDPSQFPVFYPDWFIESLAKISKDYYTDGLGKITDAQLQENVNRLIPETIKYTGAYIDAIYGYLNEEEEWKRMGLCGKPPDPSNPGGDHPDDRFDVSDEFYWERKFGLSDGDLTNLYLRTAVKKGKIAVWCKDQFLQTFFEGRTNYMDAPPDVKDAIEARFQALGKKLERASKSDWTGSPDIALFTNGFYNPSISLMLKIGEPVRFLDFEFDPKILKDHPVLLVPTGGFYGLKNTASLKTILEEYVKNGGTLVVLTQQHGQDWELLPTEVSFDTGERKPIGGYGYQEDQSCQYNSVYIDTYHPILSGFSASTANIGVDGYFTSYPADSTVLLRRTANGQPAMITYPYGQGYVIATTLYTDFALAHNQANQAEINLMQNIISWAKKPDKLTEIKPGQTVSATVSISNYTDANASSVKFNFLDPSRKVISEQTQSVGLLAGQSAEIPVSFNSTSISGLGIYHIDYTLVDSQGNVIQPQAETDSGRFVVSNPPTGKTPDKSIWFSASTSSQEVLMGAPFDYTFHIFNNTGENRKLTIKTYLRHTQRRHEWNVVANAAGETTISGSDPFIDYYYKFETMEALLYDDFGQVIGRYELSFKALTPSADVSIQADKQYYGRGQPVTLQVSFKNRNLFDWQADFKMVIWDSGYRKVWEEVRNVLLASNGTGTVTASMTLPVDAPAGTYSITGDLFSGGGLVSSVQSRFELIRSLVSVTPTLPSVLLSDPNSILFTLVNLGKIPVTLGGLDVILLDPQGGVVSSRGQPFTLAVGEAKTVEVPISFPSLKFGNYTLTYSQSDETRTGNPSTIIISNASSIYLSFDKPSYRVRETANLAVELNNTGRFIFEGVPLTASVPEFGYLETKSINLAPGQTFSVQYAIPIPETMASGGHEVNVTLALPGGGSLMQISRFTIPEASLAVGYSGLSTLMAGETATLSLENTGGVDTTYSIEKLQIMDREGKIIFQKVDTGSILAGEKKSLMDIQIPSQAANGPAYLRASLTDIGTGKTVNFYKPMEIVGLTAAIETRMDKESYLKTEALRGISNLADVPLGIEGGNLKVAVNRVKVAGVGRSSHFLPKEGWVAFQSPRGVAIGSDGSIYVSDWEAHRIQKFDGNAKLLFKWGSRGNRDGEFNYPGSLAVGADGSVYVADAGNDRIQIFDSQGNFITKWGSEGSAPGQFQYPEAVALGPDGTLYVADSGNRRIQRFDRKGNFIQEWNVKSDIYGYDIPYPPCGLAVGPDGSVYVAGRVHVVEDYLSFAQKYDGNGNFISHLGRQDQFSFPSSSPLGLAVDPEGSVYVADSSNIQKFDRNGDFILKWGSGGDGDGQFGSPSEIAIGPDGAIYVADGGNKRIQKFESNGNFLMKWGARSNEDGYFSYPVDVTVGPDGSIYVADSGNDRIQKFDKNGNFLTKWSAEIGSDGETYSPLAIAAAPDGSVYVVYYCPGGFCYENQIQRFDSSGNLILKWGRYGTGDGQFFSPKGIAVGFDGSVYVSDGCGYSACNDRIQKFDSNGQFITKWGGKGSGDGQFDYPAGIAAGPDGSVYAVDKYNHRIQKFDQDGNFLARWGSYCITDFYNDGVLDQPCDGQFQYPSGIAVDVSGSVYVTDTDNHRIQRFDGQGNFILQWGKEGIEDGEYYWPNGVAAGPDGFIYIADDNDRVQRYISETLFETTLPINQPAGTSQEYLTDIGTLNAAGKLLLDATLLNSLGQTIAHAGYPFYVFEGNTVLMFNTDKKAYKPGEWITITGKVENRAGTSADRLILILDSKVNDQTTQLLNAGPFNIPAGGSQPFTLGAIAGEEGTVLLNGAVVQNNTTLVEVTDQYEVARPKLAVAVTVADVVGSEPFDINVEIKNTGKVETTIQFGVNSSEFGVERGLNPPRTDLEDSQEMILLPGEAKTLQYSQQISKDTTYIFSVTGDLEQTISRTIFYGLVPSIAMNPSVVYPEGHGGMPVVITNTGQAAGTIEFDFQMTPGAGSYSKTYYFLPGGSIADTLYFDLPEGDYQVTASSPSLAAPAQASFYVRKENQAEVAIAFGPQTEGLLPVSVNLQNAGSNEISGNVNVSVIGGNQIFWTSQQAFSSLSALGSQPLGFNLNPSAIPPGDYVLQVEVFNNGGQLLGMRNTSLKVSGPVFQVTQVPASETFYPGDEGTFTFKVKNVGNQEGAFDFYFKSYDLIDLTRREWLKAGEEKSIDFAFLVPLDLEEKDYFATYRLQSAPGGQAVTAQEGQVQYRLAGINLRVSAALDKQFYQEGEVAHLTLSVSTPAPLPSALNLFARVNYPGFESSQPFALASGQILPFDVPLTKITGEKLFFGIYHESGRSLHLNSLYIYKAGDVITVTTDKQVYNPAETVSVSVSGNTTGNLTLTGPNYEETFPFPGTATKSFALPETMTAGTYYISYQLSAVGGQQYNGTHAFDVDGIQVKVKEAALDKARYASPDVINLSLSVESNRNLPATLKTWVVDPDKGYTATGTQDLALTLSAPLTVSYSMPFTTSKLGIHRIIYALYAGDMLLVSGAQAFDMGEAVALGLATDLVDYPMGNEPVVAKASLFGNVPATVDFLMDGQAVASQTAVLSGFTSLQSTLPAVNLSPGRHVLKAVLSYDGLTSTKETSFIYGSSLPDLAVRIYSDPNIIDGIMKLTIVVTNQGKSASEPTTLYLYDGPVGQGSLLTTLSVESLVPGGSQTFTYSFNCLGRAGASVVSALIDPENQIYEFQKSNNQALVNFTVPDLALNTVVGQDIYFTGDTVLITGQITNLSKNPSTETILTTEVKDGTGLLVFTSSKNIPPVPAMETTAVQTPWATDLNLPEGIYSIGQSLGGRESTRKSVTLKPGKDFSIASETPNRKVEVGEDVQYVLALTPQRGVEGEVNLSIQGCPPGFSLSFNPNPVILSGGSAFPTLTLHPSGTVQSGSYKMKVNATGLGKSHTVDLSLDLTDFLITVVPATQALKQLDGASFTLHLAPLHDFDSLVNLTINEVPVGMKTNPSPNPVTLPSEVRLDLATSKWLLPGTYDLTITAMGRVVSHAAVVRLTVDRNPALAPRIVTAPGPMNRPVIEAFQVDGTLLTQFLLSESKGDTNIATGDIDGDGVDEIIAGVGWKIPKSPATLGAYRKDGTPVAVMETDHWSGMTVASADLDGDWVEEVAVGSFTFPRLWEVDFFEWLLEGRWEEIRGRLQHKHLNASGLVKIYKVINGKFVDTGLELEPYGKEGYWGAPNIAFGEVDGDGHPELITAPGPDPAAPAHIKVFKIDTSRGVGQWRIAAQISDLIVHFGEKKDAHDKKGKDKGEDDLLDGFGAHLSMGDVDGDGKAEIIVGAGPDSRKSGRVIILYNQNGTYHAETFEAFKESRMGVYVSSKDVDGDGVAEIITGAGPDMRNKPVVRIFRRDGTMVDEFQAYPNNIRLGVKVSAGGVGEK
jgi:tripartite motif-containing protein 71